MPQVSSDYNKHDGLEVRSWDGGFGVYDRATKKFVSSKHSSLYWVALALNERRADYRPLIVRWFYGLSTKESLALGITKLGYDAVEA